MRRSVPPIAVLAASLALVPTGSARAPHRTHGARGAAYAGRTSDRHGVSFAVRGGRISGFSFRSRFRCGRSGSFVAHASYDGIKVHRGRFAARFATRDRSIQTTISGVIRGRRASGRIQRTAHFNARRKLDPRGTLVCTSKVSWTAHRRR